MFNLEENEKIIKIVRKHWLAIVVEMFLAFCMALLPIIFFDVMENVLFADSNTESMFLFLFFYVIFLVFVWIFIFISWINYYLDVWIITNKRIVDIDQKGLFNREIASLRLENIQDIKIEVFGLINTLLKIGNVHVQTASSEKEFVLYQAAHPEYVKHLIMQAHNKEAEKVQVVKIQN